MQYTVIRSKFKEQTREEFLADRMLGIGASEIADLLNSEPYGCLRRLFMAKLGLLPADSRFDHHLERGKFFEGPVAELYGKQKGNAPRKCGTGYLKEYPFVRANADRLVDIDGETCTMEIKVPAEWSFKKIKKEGIMEAYVLQAQWQMLCYGTKKCVFVVYWADGHELIDFVIERDEKLIQKIFEEANRIWGYVIEARDLRLSPEELRKFYEAESALHEPHYAGCKNCPAFEVCHGNVSIPDGETMQAPDAYATLAFRYQEAAKDIKKLEGEREEIKEMLRAQFNELGTNKMQSGRMLITRREQSREVISTKVKECLTEEAKAKYVSSTTYDVITAKEVK